jgi:hypothetical protein
MHSQKAAHMTRTLLLLFVVLAGALAPAAQAAGRLSTATPTLTVRIGVGAYAAPWFIGGFLPEHKQAGRTATVTLQVGQKTNVVFGGNYTENVLTLNNEKGALTLAGNLDLVTVVPCPDEAHCSIVTANQVRVPLRVDDPDRPFLVFNTLQADPTGVVLLASMRGNAVMSGGEPNYCFFDVPSGTSALSIASGHELCGVEGGALHLRAASPVPLQRFDGEPGSARWRGTPAYTSGMSGCAYRFVASAPPEPVLRRAFDTVLFAPNPLPAAAGSWSVWVNPHGRTGGVVGINKAAALIGPKEASLPSIRLVDGRFHFTFSRTDCATCAQAKPVELNTWHHVVLTWSEEPLQSGRHDVAFFVDGNRIAQQVTMGSAPRDFLASIVGSQPLTKTFAVDIDEVELFGAALTSAQVKALQEAPHPARSCAAAP